LGHQHLTNLVVLTDKSRCHKVLLESVMASALAIAKLSR